MTSKQQISPMNKFTEVIQTNTNKILCRITTKQSMSTHKFIVIRRPSLVTATETVRDYHAFLHKSIDSNTLPPTDTLLSKPLQLHNKARLYTCRVRVFKEMPIAITTNFRRIVHKLVLKRSKIVFYGVM